MVTLIEGSTVMGHSRVGAASHVGSGWTVTCSPEGPVDITRETAPVTESWPEASDTNGEGMKRGLSPEESTKSIPPSALALAVRPALVLTVKVRAAAAAE